MCSDTPKDWEDTTYPSSRHHHHHRAPLKKAHGVSRNRRAGRHTHHGDDEDADIDNSNVLEVTSDVPPVAPSRRKHQNRNNNDISSSNNHNNSKSHGKMYTLLALPFPDLTVGRRVLDPKHQSRKWAGYFSEQRSAS